jgi:hypothetical protein
MAEADVRWLQRLDNDGRALGALQRAVVRELQLDHLISHEGLRAHIQRAGRVLRDQSPLHETPALGVSKHHR